MTRLSRVAAAVVLSALAALVFCSQALADADPASDVLLAADVFYPYSPPVAAGLQAELNAAVAAAHKAHFPLKVAIIASPVDLGAIPELFGKPQQYATFLDQEISFAVKAPVLVVMPNGLGTAGFSRPAAAVAALGRPASTTGNGLTQAAIGAVRKLAAAAGHPLGRVSRGSASGGGGTGVAVPLAILVVVCVAGAAAILAVRRRGARPATRRR